MMAKVFLSIALFLIHSHSIPKNEQQKSYLVGGKYGLRDPGNDYSSYYSDDTDARFNA